jgi:hypothetical protein
MTFPSDMTDPYHVFSVLDFDDDTISVQELGRGTLQECQRIAELINAVMYNGPKRVRQSLIRIISDAEFHEYFSHV